MIEHLRPEQTRKLFIYLFEQGFMTKCQIVKITNLNDAEIRSLVRERYIKLVKSYFDNSILYVPIERAKFYLKANDVKVFVNEPNGAPFKNELHDRRLTDIRILFDQMNYSHWQSERCLNQRGMKKLRPDAILSIGQRKIAIELELTNKGCAHYLKRFKCYEEHPAIDAVLYVVSTPPFRDKLIRICKNYPNVYFTVLNHATDYKENAFVMSAQFPEPIPLWKFLAMIKERRCGWPADRQSYGS